MKYVNYEIEYLIDSPARNPINMYSAAKWLELAVVADYSVIDFHGARVQQYILALLNIVSHLTALLLYGSDFRSIRRTNITTQLYFDSEFNDDEELSGSRDGGKREIHNDYPPSFK